MFTLLDFWICVALCTVNCLHQYSLNCFKVLYFDLQAFSQKLKFGQRPQNTRGIFIELMIFPKRGYPQDCLDSGTLMFRSFCTQPACLFCFFLQAVINAGLVPLIINVLKVSMQACQQFDFVIQQPSHVCTIFKIVSIMF